MEVLISTKAFRPAGINARNAGMLIAITIPHATNPTRGFVITTKCRNARHTSNEQTDATVNGASNR